jgi:hypothetical protein
MPKSPTTITIRRLALGAETRQIDVPCRRANYNHTSCTCNIASCHAWQKPCLFLRTRQSTVGTVSTSEQTLPAEDH